MSAAAVVACDEPTEAVMLPGRYPVQSYFEERMQELHGVRKAGQLKISVCLVQFQKTIAARRLLLSQWLQKSSSRTLSGTV